MSKNAYAQSGVDVEAGYEVVERIKKHVAKTERLGVMGALGGFGGMFDLTALDVKEPVLISGTDGVGTKLMLAIQYDGDVDLVSKGIFFSTVLSVASIPIVAMFL